MTYTVDLDDGFYWVRCGLTWTIAERWTNKAGRVVWFVTGQNRFCRDSDFDEIDPRPIKRAQAEALKIATEALESIMHTFKPDFDEDQSADAAEAEIMATQALARIKEVG